MIAKFSISTLVGSLAFAAAAHAGPMEAPRSDVVDVSASVSVDGLELTTSKGAATALTRIKAAASQVCGAKPEPSQLAANAQYRACVKKTTDRTVAQMNSPLVTALHSAAPPARLAAVQD